MRVASALVGRLVRVEDADFDRRGFRTADPASRDHLQSRAAAFMTGAHAALGPAPIHDALDSIDPDHRGFAYEGAAMTSALVDLIHGTVPRRLSLLRAGPGVGYRHLIHVGVGWALGRVHLSRPPTWWAMDPLLSWLALDGAGFQQMFFAPAAQRDKVLRAPTSPAHQIRMHGAGRALWFVHAADADSISMTIAAAPAASRAPLWSGVGLAAVYAGAPKDKSRVLLALSGTYGSALAQGVVFGATARHAHGHACPSAEAAARAVTGMGLEQCSLVSDQAATGLGGNGGSAGDYLRWVARVRDLCAEQVRSPNRALS